MQTCVSMWGGECIGCVWRSECVGGMECRMCVERGGV